MAVIVELRNAGGVVEALVVRLLGEEHVVFAECVGGRVRILRGSFVPEGEMALAADQVGAEDASVVGETGQGRRRFASILRQRERRKLEAVGSRRTAEGGCPRQRHDRLKSRPSRAR